MNISIDSINFMHMWHTCVIFLYVLMYYNKQVINYSSLLQLDNLKQDRIFFLQFLWSLFPIKKSNYLWKSDIFQFKFEMCVCITREDARWGAQGARAPQKFQILIYKSSPKKIPEKIYILGTLFLKILPSSLMMMMMR